MKVNKNIKIYKIAKVIKKNQWLFIFKSFDLIY